MVQGIRGGCVYGNETIYGYMVYGCNDYSCYYYLHSEGGTVNESGFLWAMYTGNVLKARVLVVLGWW